MSEDADAPKRDQIAVVHEAADAAAVDVAVNFVEPAKKKKKARRQDKARPQMGKKRSASISPVKPMTRAAI